MGILDEIATQRRADVAVAKTQVSENALREKIQQLEAKLGPAIDVLARLNAAPPPGWSKMALAAEFKRASPSKGDIAPHLNVEAQTKLYAMAGASMISVLTEPKWFKGSLEDLLVAREAVQEVEHRPALLRKEFVVDSYQLLEARAFGADAVLLIVAILTPEELQQFIQETLALGMTPLVEVNCVEELHVALAAGAKLIGVNNRNLRTFKVDLEATVHVADEIRKHGVALGLDGVTLLSLSGIHSRADVVKFEQCGAQGILVGETLMKSGDPKTMMERLMLARRASNDPSEVLPQPLAKICGITSLEYAMAAVRGGASMIGLIMVQGKSRSVSIDLAKTVVEAVRRYGERSGPILPEIIKSKGLDPSLPVPEWYQRNASALREACARAPLVVGVFMNSPPEEINRIAEEVGLDIVQLHGDEGFEVCRDINFPTIRAYHLPDHISSDSVDAEGILKQIKSGYANFLLLDTSVRGQQGGTGVTFDWKIANIFAQARLPCLMAGGLTPGNVAKAIVIAHPLGVDVSSGVEVKGSDGEKDLHKVEGFLKIVQDHLAVATLTIEENEELCY